MAHPELPRNSLVVAIADSSKTISKKEIYQIPRTTRGSITPGELGHPELINWPEVQKSLANLFGVSPEQIISIERKK